jgi:enoyl-CoA hydratase
MGEYKTLILIKEGNLAILWFNRPEKLNALNTEVYIELSQAFDEIKKDTTIRVVLLTGKGDRAFIAGADIVELMNYSSFDARKLGYLAKECGDKIETLGKPVIAAINGFALGGGCEIALACDLRICSEDAKFGLPEIKLGVIPGSGGTQRLTRLIGSARSKELIYTGKIIDAKEALELGIVNRIASKDHLMGEARNLAKEIGKKSGIALALAKAAINRSMNVSLESGLNYEIECFALCFSTEDQKEGMQAFLEKRDPRFKSK